MTLTETANTAAEQEQELAFLRYQLVLARYHQAHPVARYRDRRANRSN